MSWHRDEAANQQEALDKLTESQRDLADTLREYFTQDHVSGDGYTPPRGGEGGSGIDGSGGFDIRGITEFNQAMRDSVGPIRVFARSLDMLSEKLEESLVQARDMQQAGSFNPQPKPNPHQAAQLPGSGGGGAAAPLAFPTSPLFRPTSYMIPNQYGGFTTYGMGGAAAPSQQPITVPSSTLNPGQVRRRQARRRSIMRKFNRSLGNANAWRGIGRAAYMGGIFGGVKGAIRGAGAGIMRQAVKHPALIAAGLVAAMPFMMSGLVAAGDKQVDANRHYALAAPDTARALAQYDVNSFLRNMAEARATSGTATKLIESQDYAKAQQQPFDILMKNTWNAISTAGNNIAGKFFELTNPLWEKLNSLFGDDSKKGPAGNPALSAMVGGALGVLGINLDGVDGWKTEEQKKKEIEAGLKEAARVDSSFLDMRFAPKVRKL